VVLVRESRSHVLAQLRPPVLRGRAAGGDRVPVGSPRGIVRERFALALGRRLEVGLREAEVPGRGGPVEAGPLVDSRRLHQHAFGHRHECLRRLVHDVDELTRNGVARLAEVARLDDQEAVSHVDHLADDAIVTRHDFVPTHPCLLPVGCLGCYPSTARA